MAFLKVANRAISSLASGVDDAVTEWTLATGEGALFPSSGDFHVTCEDEIVKCTSRTGDVLTVSRHEEGTDAAAHASGKAVKLQITAEIIEEIQDILDGGIDKTHLSQDFGSSALRLHAWNFTPKQGAAFYVANAATSPFSGVINGNPTATEVVYDGEANENCLKGLGSGATRWGRFVLHNTTRGNSRLIVDFDEVAKEIATEPSTDDWADGDVVTLQSQTCTQAGYMDVDLSDEIDSNVIVIFIQVEALDKSALDQAGRRLIVHPFEAYNSGKRLMCPASLANEFTVIPCLLPVVSQKLCVFFDDWTDFAPQISVLATLEYADT